MSEQREITITKVEFDELLQAWYYREAMIATGADEWLGYETALEVMDDLKRENTYGRE